MRRLPAFSLAFIACLAGAPAFAKTPPAPKADGFAACFAYYEVATPCRANYVQYMEDDAKALDQAKATLRSKGEAILAAQSPAKTPEQITAAFDAAVQKHIATLHESMSAECEMEDLTDLDSDNAKTCEGLADYTPGANITVAAPAAED